MSNILSTILCNVQQHVCCVLLPGIGSLDEPKVYAFGSLEEKEVGPVGSRGPFRTGDAHVRMCTSTLY